jgi:hypothetical protein
MTGVEESATLSVPAKGETISLALSGTYNMTVVMERAVTPDETAWEVVLGPYTTEDATVAADYITDRTNEKFRVRVKVDTSGTVTYSIADGVKQVAAVTDDEGNGLFTHTQEVTTVHKQLEIEAGSVGPAPVAATAATLAVTALLHAGRTIKGDKADGIVFTLPLATGTGNKYKFYVGTTITSNGFIVKVGDATDTMTGGLAFGVDDDGEGATGYTWMAESGDDTITLNGTSTGGKIGDIIEVEDVATNVWAINQCTITQSGGSEATPFTATVS